MRVEVETDEALGLSMPRKFYFDWRATEVAEIIDRWFGAGHRYCKLKGDAGALYILRLDEQVSRLLKEPADRPHGDKVSLRICRLFNVTNSSANYT